MRERITSPGWREDMSWVQVTGFSKARELPYAGEAGVSSLMSVWIMSISSVCVDGFE